MVYNYVTSAVSTAANSESLPTYSTPQLFSKYVRKRIKFILACVSVLYKIYW